MHIDVSSPALVCCLCLAVVTIVVFAAAAAAAICHCSRPVYDDPNKYLLKLMLL